MGFIHNPYQGGKSTEKKAPGLSPGFGFTWLSHFTFRSLSFLIYKMRWLVYMIPKFPSALNVHDILTCPPSESEEGIKDTSVAKHPAGKEEHSVSWPTRPICSSQGDFGHYHMVSNFSWVIYHLLSPGVWNIFASVHPASHPP